MAAPRIRKAMETSSVGQDGKVSIHSLSLRQSQAQTQNRTPTAMAADAATVHAVSSRVPGPVERRRYRRPAISSRTGMSPHKGYPRDNEPGGGRPQAAGQQQAGHDAERDGAGPVLGREGSRNEDDRQEAGHGHRRNDERQVPQRPAAESNTGNIDTPQN
jgi:hypothetical protein